jgi:hypothetical protein
MKLSQLFFTLSLCLFYTCTQKQEAAISFYYWKTNFNVSAAEAAILYDNHVRKLYVRYFDVDKEPGQPVAQPVSPIVLSESLNNCNIIPVVYIKKRVFENIDSSNLPGLAKNILSLIQQINQSRQISNTEVQFDCDWTERTKHLYFSFISIYRSISKQGISATIRLHQVKYYQRTGVPPVDYGVLMYYNMGEINAGNKNSVYDKAIAAKYNPSLVDYPLVLDVALPIFAWAQQIRDGQVVGLLNKINGGHFADDSNFTVLGKNRLLVKHAGFKAGYYFREKDEVKLESVSEGELLGMVKEINKYLPMNPRTIIFYDLDSINTTRYEKGIYKKVLDGFN